MKKEKALFILAIIITLSCFGSDLYSDKGKTLFLRAYTEGRIVFYRYLSQRAQAASLERKDRECLLLAEKKIPNLYEHLMNIYFWLNDWDQQNESRIMDKFKGISGRMAVEFVQSIPENSPVSKISPLSSILFSTGYYARKILPQFRRFIRPINRRFKRQWALKYLEIDQVHKITRGKNIRIAIVDTGIDPSIRETRVRTKKYKNLLDASLPLGDKGRFPIDWKGHGTAVASVVYQVAPEAELMIVKFYDSESMNNVPPSRWTGYLMAAGIRWAVDNGADVINISAAFRFDLKEIRDAVAYCWEKNVILVTAVGNKSSEGIKNIPCYPAAYGRTIAVGGVERREHGLAVWKRSAHGEYIDLVAPAENMWVQSPQYRGRSRLSNFAKGNSMAASIVSGSVALMLAAMDQKLRQGLREKPGELSEVVRKILRQTSSNEVLGFSSPNAASGYGIVDVRGAVERILLLPVF